MKRISILTLVFSILFAVFIVLPGLLSNQFGLFFPGLGIVLGWITRIQQGRDHRIIGLNTAEILIGRDACPPRSF